MFINNIPPKIIFVYSGKGGVGKSIVSVNLAYKFKQIGYRVGLIDADITGPSIPTMVNKIVDTHPYMEGLSIKPGSFGGLLVNSIGFLCDPFECTFWTKKYIQGALYQFIFSIKWDVDILIIDLPPGISEIHRELFSKINGKVLFITTPHKLCYSDNCRCIDFVKRMRIEVIGMVENMSYMFCEKCNSENYLFCGDSQKEFGDKFAIDILSKIPIDPKMSYFSDIGIPYVLKNQGTFVDNQFLSIAESIIRKYEHNEILERSI